MIQRYPQVQPRGFWKHETNSWANEMANQEAQDRAAIRLLGGRLWELKGDELLDAIVEELNAVAERSTDEYRALQNEIDQQAAIEARTIPFSDVYHTWMVSVMEGVPLWEVAERAEDFFVLIEGFDTQREFQYLLDIFQDAIHENRVTKRPQIDRAIEWIREQLRRVEQQPEAPALPGGAQLQWLGTKTDLAELAYALLEAGCIAGPRGKAVATLANAFGVANFGKPEGVLQRLKERSEERAVTPLLDKLKDSLTRYLRQR